MSALGASFFWASLQQSSLGKDEAQTHGARRDFEASCQGRALAEGIVAVVGLISIDPEILHCFFCYPCCLLHQCAHSTLGKTSS